MGDIIAQCSTVPGRETLKRSPLRCSTMGTTVTHAAPGRDGYKLRYQVGKLIAC